MSFRDYPGETVDSECHYAMMIHNNGRPPAEDPKRKKAKRKTVTRTDT